MCGPDGYFGEVVAKAKKVVKQAGGIAVKSAKKIAKKSKSSK